MCLSFLDLFFAFSFYSCLMQDWWFGTAFLPWPVCPICVFIHPRALFKLFHWSRVPEWNVLFLLYASWIFFLKATLNYHILILILLILTVLLHWSWGSMLIQSVPKRSWDSSIGQILGNMFSECISSCVRLIYLLYVHDQHM